MTGEETRYLLAALATLAGLGVGWLHFHSLKVLANRIVEGDRRAVALQILRLAMLAGFLLFCAQAGAIVLLAAALGIFLGRMMVMRGQRRAGS